MKMDHAASVEAPAILDAPFCLLETMACEAGGRIVRLGAHMDRLERSARQLAFAFDRGLAEHRLQDSADYAGEAIRLRLRLARDGAMTIDSQPAPAPFGRPLRVQVQPMTLPADDFRLRHKTTVRGHYDGVRQDAARAAPIDELLFTDADGFLTEGSFTNLFVLRDDGLVTPPLSRGLLPGVLRHTLIADGLCREEELRVEDLADGFLLGNSLRGLMEALLLPGD